MVLSVRPDVSGRVDKIILPGLPAVGDGLLHLWTSGHTRLSASGSKGQRKKKNRQNPVKAPLWHKHKRKGPCLISLNYCLGVRQSPFLRLCDSRHTFVQNPFVRWCARIKPLLRKNLYEKKKIREIHFKISRFIVTFAYEEFFEGYATHRRIMQ